MINIQSCTTLVFVQLNALYNVFAPPTGGVSCSTVAACWQKFTKLLSDLFRTGSDLVNLTRYWLLQFDIMQTSCFYRKLILNRLAEIVQNVYYRSQLKS